MTRNGGPGRPIAREPRTTSLATRVGWGMLWAAALGMIALIALGRMERDRSYGKSATAAAERRGGAVLDGPADSATPSGAEGTSPVQSSAPRLGPAAGDGDTLTRRAAPPPRRLEGSPPEWNAPRPAEPAEGGAEEPRL